MSVKFENNISNTFCCSSIPCRTMKLRMKNNQLQLLKKKLRSKLPRRRRTKFTNIPLPSLCFETGVSQFSVDSSSCSDFEVNVGEVSCNSSRVSVGLNKKELLNARKRHLDEVIGYQDEEEEKDCRSRRFQKRNETDLLVSESACVDPNSDVRDLKLNLSNGRLREAEDATESDITCIHQSSCENLNYDGRNIKGVALLVECDDGSVSSGDKNLKAVSHFSENDDISTTSGVIDKQHANQGGTARESEFEASAISRSEIYVSCNDSHAESKINHFPVEFDSDLACNEELPSEDVSEYYTSSHETVFSELQSEFFPEYSDFDFSESSPSLFDSGSDFSQGSIESNRSPTFAQFLQYREEFSRSTITSDCLVSEGVDDKEKLLLENLDDEKSYRMLRARERKKNFLHNYTERYCSTTEHGDLILQQRSQMVHWIVEQSDKKKLRQETLFLGVSVLDRFLSKGYFKDKRCLQIVGIASLTLATRMEENQPYNSVRQHNFNVKDNVYSRQEVIAMEWMVLEVLNFECFRPTIFNFLWFYLKAVKADGVLEKRVKYLAVLSLSTHEHLRYWPSIVAAALVILASPQFSRQISHQVLLTHFRPRDELHECIKVLRILVKAKGYLLNTRDW